MNIPHINIALPSLIDAKHALETRTSAFIDKLDVKRVVDAVDEAKLKHIPGIVSLGEAGIKNALYSVLLDVRSVFSTEMKGIVGGVMVFMDTVMEVPNTINMFRGLKSFVVSHPYLSCLGLVLAPIIIKFVVYDVPVTFIRFLGFGIRGVIKGSTAAGYQSLVYGAHIQKNSMFSMFQSIGAAGLRNPRWAVVGWGGVAAGVVYLKYTNRI